MMLPMQGCMIKHEARVSYPQYMVWWSITCRDQSHVDQCSVLHVGLTRHKAV